VIVRTLRLARRPLEKVFDLPVPLDPGLFETPQSCLLSLDDLTESTDSVVEVRDELR
jgi:hypothetical protein